MILEKKEPFLGILIRYDTGHDLSGTKELKKNSYNPAIPVAGVIGAGNFAQNLILPNLKGLVNFCGIATAHGNTSLYTGEKYGFDYCTTDTSQIINDKKINTVFIATRHNLHAEQVIGSLKAGKHVFVEKPLTLNIEELEKIRQTYVSIEDPPKLMVGYNRRFAPFTLNIMNILQSGQPKAINMRINAGSLPHEHWTQDMEIGGGRITGEACHFIDLAVYLAGSPVVLVSATDLSSKENLMDSFSATLKFRNGSIASIIYLSNGNKEVSKELIEVFCNGTISRIDDFKKFEFFGKRKIRSKSNQDKGHKQELKLFAESVSKGLPSPIPFEELYHSSLVTFRLIESIRTGRTIEIVHVF
jgi:polar amino acid transport system substrate-binding protein